MHLRNTVDSRKNRALSVSNYLLLSCDYDYIICYNMNEFVPFNYYRIYLKHGIRPCLVNGRRYEHRECKQNTFWGSIECKRRSTSALRVCQSETQFRKKFERKNGPNSLIFLSWGCSTFALTAFFINIHIFYIPDEIKKGVFASIFKYRVKLLNFVTYPIPK